jgi:hypothetical protein
MYCGTPFITQFINTAGGRYYYRRENYIPRRATCCEAHSKRMAAWNKWISDTRLTLAGKDGALARVIAAPSNSGLQEAIAPFTATDPQQQFERILQDVKESKAVERLMAGSDAV